jgi:glutamate N-acetyltransferase/amino-acid N-acetyltransferase
MPPIAGVKLATAAAGVKYLNRTDVLLALLSPGTAVAGVLTKSKCPSAPVEWCRANLKQGKARALVVNSGNANAFTGKTGPIHREDRGPCRRLYARRRVSRLDRRDRRTAQRQGI